MNKADLIDLLASTHSLSKAESGRILETLLSTIVKTVKKGGSVGIAGFGAFKMQARSARGGYNPATRSKMKIPAVKVPKFTPGTAFRAEVDPRAEAFGQRLRAGCMNVLERAWGSAQPLTTVRRHPTWPAPRAHSPRRPGAAGSGAA